jgi:hypothetical protein
MNYKKKTLQLILVATIIRCIVACSINLGNDEVYYRMYAQYLQWNYFDHPPMVGWLINFTTVHLFFDTTFFIRLSAILSAAIVTWLFYLCGKKIGNKSIGFLSALIYTTTIYGSIIAGTFILPDSSQLIFWLLGLFCLLQICQQQKNDKHTNMWVLLFSIAVGMGMLCKVHSIFLWIGFVGYCLLYDRNRFKQSTFYYAIIITLLFCYPILKWNINNNFVTYKYHGNRVNVVSTGINLSYTVSFLAGQVFYFNPILIFVFIKSVFKAIKNKLPIQVSHKNILLLCSLPLISIATIISLFKNVLPHWTGPAYTSIIIFTAVHFSNFKKNIATILKFAYYFILVVSFVGIAIINFYPGTIGKKDELLLGEGDFTLDMYGWNSIKKDVQLFFDDDIKKGLMKPNASIICNKWFPAAHIDFYIAMPLHKKMIAIGDTNDIHQYVWINKERKKLIKGDDAYCIVPSNNYVDVKNIYGNKFEKILEPQIIFQKRNGTICRKFYLFKCKNFVP